MKLALAATVLTFISAPAFAPSAFGQEVPKPAPPAAEEKPAAAPANPESVKQAETLMAEVAKSYKNAATLTDTMKMDIQSPMGGQQQEIKVVIGKGKDASMTLPGMIVTAVDEKLYITREDVKDKYLEVKLQGDMFETMRELFGQEVTAPVQFALHSGEGSPEENLQALTMGMLQDVKLTGHETVKTDDGASMHQVNMSGEGGTGMIQIHPETKLIHLVKLEFTPPGAPDGFDIKASMTMSPKVHAELPTPIAFSPGSRKAVDSFEELEPTPIKVGDMAPDFTLPALDGETVTLSKLRDSIVVLDFWATWCPPCRKGLPLLQEFADWVKESGQPVKVYAVNVLERTSNADETKEKVKEFWTDKGFTMTTLLDLDKSVFPDYGFSGIPATVVIGRDGKVVNVHGGFDEDMVNMLKKDVEEALKVKTAG